MVSDLQETGGWSSAKMLLDVYGHYLVSESSVYADALTPANGPPPRCSHGDLS